MKKSKKAFELPFGMIFSIIAGSVILFLAIYATTKLVSYEQKTSYSESSLAISNLMNPIVNGITSSYATKINFRKETRIYLNCSATDYKSPYFGSERISFSEESGFLKKWTEPGAEIRRNNKYIFSDNIIQGKNLYIFSKPIFLGFRVDDFIVLSMKEYCFVAPPENVQNEIENLGININVTASIAACKPGSTKVCFGNSFGTCDVNVYGECNDNFCTSVYDSGRVVKNSKTVYYAGNLIYAAIFSSPQIYDCNLQRLGKKTAELARIYKEKINIIKRARCNTLIEPYLDKIISLSENLTSQKLQDLNYQSKLMDNENCDNNQCKVYQSEEC